MSPTTSGSNLLGLASFLLSAVSLSVFTSIIAVLYPSPSNILFCLSIFSESLPVPSITNPSLPLIYKPCCFAVSSFALSRIPCPFTEKILSGFISRPAFFSAFSNAVSLLTTRKPKEVSPVFPTINVLPDPGPPARNIALNIAGSFTPSSISFICSANDIMFYLQLHCIEILTY